MHALRNGSELAVLDLSDNNLGAKLSYTESDEITSTIQKNVFLLHLDLSCCALNHDFLGLLKGKIVSNRTLVGLHIERNSNDFIIDNQCNIVEVKGKLNIFQEKEGVVLQKKRITGLRQLDTLTGAIKTRGKNCCWICDGFQFSYLTIRKETILNILNTCWDNENGHIKFRTKVETSSRKALFKLKIMNKLLNGLESGEVSSKNIVKPLIRIKKKVEIKVPKTIEEVNCRENLLKWGISPVPEKTNFEMEDLEKYVIYIHLDFKDFAGTTMTSDGDHYVLPTMHPGRKLHYYYSINNFCFFEEGESKIPLRLLALEGIVGSVKSVRRGSALPKLSRFFRASWDMPDT